MRVERMLDVLSLLWKFLRNVVPQNGQHPRLALYRPPALS